MNLNELAKQISVLEGGKKNLSIAQIKEVIKCFSILFFDMDACDKANLIIAMKAAGKRHSK